MKVALALLLVTVACSVNAVHLFKRIVGGDPVQESQRAEFGFMASM